MQAAVAGVVGGARVAAPRATRRCGVRAAARCSVESAGAAVPVGSRVRVKDAITCFHAPKHKAGLSLQGLVGTVDKYSDVAPDGLALLSSTQARRWRLRVMLLPRPPCWRPCALRGHP